MVVYLKSKLDSACFNVPMSISESGLRFDVADNFAVSTNEICTKIKISFLHVEPFEQEVSKTFSSLAIISESQQASNKRIFVFNHQNPGVAIGQLLGDGYGLRFSTPQSEFTGLRICVPFPEEYIDWELRSGIATRS